MIYKTILDAIETLIKADATANGAIKLYRRYTVEQGVRATPVCVIGTTTELELEQCFLSASGGAQTRLWGVTLGISILGHSYPTQAQMTTEADILDTLQSAVARVLNADPRLGDTVTIVVNQRVRDVVSDEYFGHEILITAEAKED